MPTYEYKCGDCGHTIEIMQSMNDGPVDRSCEKCGGNMDRKIGPGSGVIGLLDIDY